MTKIFDSLVEHWYRASNEAPAAPAATNPPTGGHVELAKLAQDTATDAATVKGWLDHTVGVRIPALLAEVQRYQASPIVQALEDAALSPEAEAAIATLIRAAATTAAPHSTMANDVPEPVAPVAVQPAEPAA